MKTLHELLKEYTATNQLIATKRNEISDLRKDISSINMEIFERFAPKDLVGLECDILKEPWHPKTPTKSSYDSLMNDNAFLVNGYSGNYRESFKGRKCKIVGYALMAVNADGSLSWKISAAAANADGTFGKLFIYTTIIDKSHLSD